MKLLNTALMSALILSGAALSAPCFAQAAATTPTLNLGNDPLLGTTESSQASDPAPGAVSYMPQQSGTDGSAAPSTALDQVNLGSMTGSDPQNATSPQ
jgi:hypothetical protein